MYTMSKTGKPARVLLFIAVFTGLGQAVRIKDVADVSGLSDIQVTGFGLVTGLRNTGDSPRTMFTTKGIVNMLRNIGIEVPQDRVRVRNVAAVMVSATLTPFAKKGSRVDVNVSSIGDARSLEGGTLLMSPLTGPDGKSYATAQGPVSIGGFNVEGDLGLATVRKNHALSGEVTNGAVVLRERPSQMVPVGEVKFTLDAPDFSSAVEMAGSINKQFGMPIARAEDAATVAVKKPEDYAGSMLVFMAELENVDFTPSQPARVVLNEKTGTIVAGGAITISPVAVSHGNITISINAEQQAQGTVVRAQGRTAARLNTEGKETAVVEEPKTETRVMPKVTNVNELADALNSLGVSPRDIISIFQSIKRAGALHADLMVM